MTDQPPEPIDPVLDRTREDSDSGGSPQPSGRRRWMLVAGGAVAVLAVIWLVVAQLSGPQTGSGNGGVTETPIAGVGTDAGEARRIQATLFYVSDDGTLLVPTTRDVLYGATPAEQARRIVEAQVQTPAGLASAIPEGTIVRSVFLTASNEAYVDLGGAVQSGHTGGSLDEALAIYAIVNAVTTNLPEVVGVQVLVEGREVDTLAGHMDLRFPLARAADWIQKGQ